MNFSDLVTPVEFEQFVRKRFADATEHARTGKPSPGFGARCKRLEPMLKILANSIPEDMPPEIFPFYVMCTLLLVDEMIEYATEKGRIN